MEFNGISHRSPREPDINSFPPSAAYMRQWMGSSLFLIMACRLFGAIIWTNAWLLSIRTLGTNFSKIRINIPKSSLICLPSETEYYASWTKKTDQSHWHNSVKTWHYSKIAPYRSSHCKKYLLSILSGVPVKIKYKQFSRNVCKIGWVICTFREMYCGPVLRKTRNLI